MIFDVAYSSAAKLTFQLNIHRQMRHQVVMGTESETESWLP